MNNERAEQDSERRRQRKRDSKAQAQDRKAKIVVEKVLEPQADEESDRQSDGVKSFQSIQRRKRWAAQSQHSQYKEMSSGSGSVDWYEEHKAKRRKKARRSSAEAAAILADRKANKYKRDLRDLARNQAYWLRERDLRERQQRERPDSFCVDPTLCITQLDGERDSMRSRSH